MAGVSVAGAWWGGLVVADEEAVGEDGETGGEFFALEDDVVGDVEGDGGEVPDGANADLDHGVGDGLGVGGGDGENADLDVFAFGEGGHFVDVVDVFTGDGFADDGGVGVEAGDDADAVLIEAFVAEEGAA